MRALIFALLLLAAGCSQEITGSATGASTTTETSTASLPDRSPPSDQAVTLTFVNRTDAPCDVLWLDFEGDLVQYSRIEPGDEIRQPTYTGHIWIVRDPDGEELLRFAAERTGEIVID
ncbi:hypothetical protein [Actinokineospora sp. HUAS TT18]|uniref:VHL beta domain-containing protein n=1 Tax=Actinokineospora sp. HUAS TT18 TaxID=3447451 RepID=UPI003F523C9F